MQHYLFNIRNLFFALLSVLYVSEHEYHNGIIYLLFFNIFLYAQPRILSSYFFPILHYNHLFLPCPLPRFHRLLPLPPFQIPPFLFLLSSYFFLLRTHVLEA